MSFYPNGSLVYRDEPGNWERYPLPLKAVTTRVDVVDFTAQTVVTQTFYNSEQVSTPLLLFPTSFVGFLLVLLRPFAVRACV